MLDSELVSLVLAASKGDRAAVLAIIDLLQERIRFDSVQVEPMQKLSAEFDNLRFVLHVERGYQLDDLDLDSGTLLQALRQWWMFGEAPLVLNGIARVEVFQRA